MLVDNGISSHFHRLLQATFGSSLAEKDLNQSIDRFSAEIRSSRIQDRVSHLLVGIEQEREKFSEPMEIFVVGEGKFGKSTLINALLGGPYAETDRLPKTWCFNRYLALPAPSQRVAVFLSGSGANRFSQEEKAHHDELLQKVGPCRGIYRGLNRHEVSWEAAKSIVQAEEDWCTRRNHHQGIVSPIMEMEWQVPDDNALVSQLRLVDTQGINQLHSDAEHLHHLKWQYERADAVIWLVAADNIGSQASRNEMREASRYAKHLIIVLNKWDQIQDRQTALDLARKHYGDFASELVPFSALGAYLARIPANTPMAKHDQLFLKRNGNPNAEQLRERSGLMQLQSIMRTLEVKKQQRMKRVQLYSSLRQRQREYRDIAQHVETETKSNIDLFLEVKRQNQAAHQQSLAQSQSSFQSLKYGTLSKVKHSIAKINYDNRNQADALIGLDAVNLEIRKLEASLVDQAVARYSNTLNWLNSQTLSYSESEYAPTAAVAARILTTCCRQPQVDVKPMDTHWAVPALNGFGSFRVGVAEFLGLFPNWTQNKKMEITAQIQQRLREDILPQIEDAIMKTARGVEEAITTTFKELGENFQRQVDHLGGLERLTQLKDSTARSKRMVAVPPILLQRTLSFLQQKLRRTNHAIA